jgi:hypothetical protein
MRRPDPVEQAIDRLNALRRTPDAPVTMEELRGFIASKVNLVAAKAAGIAGDSRLAELIPDLVGAFQRFMTSPGKLDKGCAATTEIVGALYQMDYSEPEVYLKGIHHVQLESSFGRPVDTAAGLRARSALGLVRTRHPDALLEVVPLLVDAEPQARTGAVRALASVGGETVALLLRLKVLTGDPEPDVIGECFAGLLEAMPETSLPFVAEFVDSEDLAVSEAAILALGRSRRPEAFEILKQKWERTVRGPLRRALLLSMATARLDAAIQFLLSLLDTGSVQTAAEAVAALAIYRGDARIRLSVESLVSRRGEELLIDVFRHEFQER